MLEAEQITEFNGKDAKSAVTEVSDPVLICLYG